MADTPTVEALLTQWISAFNRHDLDAHVDLYTEEATLFGSVDELQVGRKAIRNNFGALGSNTRVNSYPMPRTALLGPDLAVTAGHVDFADGDVPVPYPGVHANLVPDAHLAALAIEHGLMLCSTDGDFARFHGLRWHNPLAA
jgi:uncharacterized protein (TIGR02246 family)